MYSYIIAFSYMCVCEIVQKERTDFQNAFIQIVVYKGL